jgi:hypothetical protein
MMVLLSFLLRCMAFGHTTDQALQYMNVHMNLGTTDGDRSVEMHLNLRI